MELKKLVKKFFTKEGIEYEEKFLKEQLDITGVKDSPHYLFTFDQKNVILNRLGQYNKLYPNVSFSLRFEAHKEGSGMWFLKSIYNSKPKPEPKPEPVKKIEKSSLKKNQLNLF